MSLNAELIAARRPAVQQGTSFSRLLDIAADSPLNPVNLPLAALDALNYVAATTRAGVGALAGIEGSGQETIFGAAPSGRELLGMGRGTPGTFEGAEDVAGFAVELAVDPLFFLPIGKLSKAGQLAASASRAEKAIAAAGRMGLSTADEAARLARIDAQLASLGRGGERLAADWASQGRAKQRALLSAEIPFTRFSAPLVYGPRGLGAIAGAGRAVSAPFRGVYDKLFRPPTELAASAIADTAAASGRSPGEVAEEFSAAASEAMMLRRQGRRIADQETRGGRLLDIVQNEDRYRPAYDALSAAASPGIRQAISDLRSHFAGRIASARSAGDAGAAKMLRREAGRAVQRLDIFAGARPGAAGSSLLELAQTLQDTTKKHGVAVAKEIQERDALLAQIAAQLPTASASRRNALTALATETTTNAAARIQARLAHARSAKGFLAGLRQMAPDIYMESRRLSRATGDALAREAAAGSPVSELSDSWISYYRRFITPEGKTMLARLRQDIPSLTDDMIRTLNQAGGGSTLERVAEFEGLSVLQINDYMRSIARSRGLDDGFSLFVENPAEVTLRRLTEGGNRIANARLQQGLVSTFMVPKSLARGDDIPLAKYLAETRLAKFAGQNISSGDQSAIAAELKKAKLDQMYMPRELAGEALKTARIFDDPEELKGFLGFLDQANRYWRFGVTQLFPAFQVRNFIGNAFNAFLAGMKNPIWYQRAASIQAAASEGGPLARIVSPLFGGKRGLTVAETELLNDAADLGVIGSGLSKEALPGGEKALARGVRLLSRGGGTIEDNAKLALYMEGLNRGLSKREAAERVKRYLFDYGDLSDAEKRYMRRWAGFYTYQRKAIPLMLQEIATRPALLRSYGLTTGQYEGSIQGQLMPEWMLNQGNVSLGTDEQGRQTFAQPDLPPSLLFDYATEGGGLKRLGQKVVGQLAPTLKLPAEVASGINFRSGQPMQGGLQRLLLTATPATRAFDTTTRIAEAVTAPADAKQTPGDLLRNLSGLPSIRRLDEQKARLRLDIDRVNRALEKLAQEGRARRTGVDYRPIENDDSVRELLRLRSSMYSRLQ